MDGQVAAHAAAEAGDLVRLRGLSLEERGRLIQSACAAAAVIRRSRLAAGLPPAEPDPWPASTWEFLRKHAAGVRD
jgi:hypothetical protein